MLINGEYVNDYEFEYVSNWCVAENTLLAYSDTEILVKTSPSTFSIYDVSELSKTNELVEVEEYEGEFTGNSPLSMSIVNNSILHWQGGLAPNYKLYDLESQKITDLPLKLEEIETNNLSNIYSSLKVDSNNPVPRLIAISNYNNWVSYAYHDAQDLSNDNEVGRDFILHTGNQEQSKTVFVEDLTRFVPYDYSLSKDGKTLVLSTQDAGQGFVTNNLFTNQTWIYSNDYQRYVRSITVENDKLRFLEYNAVNMEYQLKKMDLNTGSVTNISILKVPDAISGFTIVNEHVFVMTNAEGSNNILVYLGIPLIIATIIIVKKKNYI